MQIYQHIDKNTWIYRYIKIQIYQCIDVYTYTNIHTHTLFFLNSHMHTYIHTSIHHACVRACVRACVHTYIHTYIHACMHASIHPYIRMYAYIHAHLPILPAPKRGWVCRESIFSWQTNCVGEGIIEGRSCWVSLGDRTCFVSI